jgi:RNA polymerase sigma factor (sigma-70 family)
MPKPQLTPTAFTRYYDDVSRTSIISDAETEKTLLYLYKVKHSQEARRLLVESLARYAVKIAKKFARGDYDLMMDLIAAGNEGIMVALDHYDLERTTRLITYATPWILLHVRTEAQKSPLVTIPAWHRRTSVKIKDAQRVIQAEKGRPATSHEIRRKVQIPTSRVERIMREDYSYISADAPPLNEKSHGLQLADCQHETGEDCAQRRELTALVKESLSVLSREERLVVCAYFGIGRRTTKKFSNIAEQLGVSRQRVQQIRHTALAKLKKKLLLLLGQDDKAEVENRNGTGGKFLLTSVFGLDD